MENHILNYLHTYGRLTKTSLSSLINKRFNCNIDLMHYIKFLTQLDKIKKHGRFYELK